MITREKIASAMKCEKIRLIVDPNLNSGTVCAIGDNNDFWFYFGGETAKDLSPEEYLRNVPEEDIVDEIYTALDRFKSCDKLCDEYALYELYEAILNQHDRIDPWNDEKALKQFHVMECFIQSCFGSQNSLAQLKELWTEHCLYCDLQPNTFVYNVEIYALWDAIQRTHKDAAAGTPCARLDDFEKYMSGDLA